MAEGRWRARRAVTPSCSTRSREESGSRARVVSVPHSMSRGCRVASPSTTPYPRTAVPGSMPSTLTGAASGFGLGQLRCVDIEVGKDFGNVVQLLEGIHKPDDALGIGTFDPHRIAGHHGKLGRIDSDSPRAEGVLDGGKCGRSGSDDVLLTLAGEVLGSACERGLERCIFVMAGCIHEDLPLAVEHPGY